ncbi:MAG: hypothetical protein Q9159_003577 [Coniocarpon cinnabarinum]
MSETTQAAHSTHASHFSRASSSSSHFAPSRSSSASHATPAHNYHLYRQQVRTASDLHSEQLPSYASVTGGLNEGPTEGLSEPQGSHSRPSTRLHGYVERWKRHRADKVAPPYHESAAADEAYFRERREQRERDAQARLAQRQEDLKAHDALKRQVPKKRDRVVYRRVAPDIINNDRPKARKEAAHNWGVRVLKSPIYLTQGVTRGLTKPVRIIQNRGMPKGKPEVVHGEDGQVFRTTKKFPRERPGNGQDDHEYDLPGLILAYCHGDEYQELIFVVFDYERHAHITGRGASKQADETSKDDASHDAESSDTISELKATNKNTNKGDQQEAETVGETSQQLSRCAWLESLLCGEPGTMGIASGFDLIGPHLKVLSSARRGHFEEHVDLHKVEDVFKGSRAARRGRQKKTHHYLEDLLKVFTDEKNGWITDYTLHNTMQWLDDQRFHHCTPPSTRNPIILSEEYLRKLRRGVFIERKEKASQERKDGRAQTRERRAKKKADDEQERKELEEWKSWLERATERHNKNLAEEREARRLRNEDRRKRRARKRQ